jgi:hypothetical protein
MTLPVRTSRSHHQNSNESSTRASRLASPWKGVTFEWSSEGEPPAAEVDRGGFARRRRLHGRPGLRHRSHGRGGGGLRRLPRLCHRAGCATMLRRHREGPAAGPTSHLLVRVAIRGAGGHLAALRFGCSAVLDAYTPHTQRFRTSPAPPPHPKQRPAAAAVVRTTTTVVRPGAAPCLPRLPAACHVLRPAPL